MINILLTIASSALVSITLKIAGRKGHSGYAILCMNYIFATIIAFVKMLQSGGLPFTAPIVIFMGLIAGFLYLFSFILCQMSIEKNGAVLTSTFMKMGIIVPIVLSQILWHEKASMVQFIGIAIAIAAILLITYQPSEKQAPTAKTMGFLMILLLLSSGLGDAMAKFYNYYGIPEANDVYIFVTFLFATILSYVLMVVKREHFNVPKICYGSVLGAVNYGSALFLLMAMNSFPSYFVYPMVNILTIAVISLVCMTFFGERLNKRQTVGLGLVLLAVVLLNV